MGTIIYKIVSRREWAAAEAAGRFHGSVADREDGFIHFSAAAQVEETARRHFAGVADLRLVAVEAGALGAALKWERSRGGALFPHLYGPLSLSDAAWVRPLPVTAGGHDFAGLIG